MDLLVFSLPHPVRCCALLPSHRVALATDSLLIIFDISLAHPTHQFPLTSTGNTPIQIIVSEGLEGHTLITVQCKMGINKLYRFNALNGALDSQLEYNSSVFGFTKMVFLPTRGLLGIQEDNSAVAIFSQEKGSLWSKWSFEEPKYCQGVCDYDAVLQDNYIRLYVGQEGWCIRSYLLQEGAETLTVQNQIILPGLKQEIQIVLFMKAQGKMLYVGLRNDPFIYAICTSTFKLLHKLDTKTELMRNLLLAQNQLYFSEGNKIYIIFLGEETVKPKLRGQLKQSRTINCLEFREGAIVGSSEEQQFFHLDLS